MSGPATAFPHIICVSVNPHRMTINRRMSQLNLSIAAHIYFGRVKSLAARAFRSHPSVSVSLFALRREKTQRFISPFKYNEIVKYMCEHTTRSLLCGRPNVFSKVCQTENEKHCGSTPISLFADFVRLGPFSLEASVE